MIHYSEPQIIDIKEKSDKILITHGHNITPILEDNYELRKRTKSIWRSKKKNPVGEFVGRVPTLVLEDWINKGLVHDNGCECGCTPQMRREMLFAMLELNPQYKVTRKTL